MKAVVRIEEADLKDLIKRHLEAMGNTVKQVRLNSNVRHSQFGDPTPGPVSAEVEIDLAGAVAIQGSFAHLVSNRGD